MNHTRPASWQCICWYMNPCRFIIISRRVRVCDSLLLVLSIHISTSITRAPFDDNATQSLCTVTHVARGQSLQSSIARNLISSWRNWAQCKLTSFASLLFSSMPTSHHLCLYTYHSLSVAVIETEHRPWGNYVIKSFCAAKRTDSALSLWCISLAMKYDRCSMSYLDFKCERVSTLQSAPSKKLSVPGRRVRERDFSPRAPTPHVIYRVIHFLLPQQERCLINLSVLMHRARNVLVNRSWIICHQFLRAVEFPWQVNCMTSRRLHQTLSGHFRFSADYMRHLHPVDKWELPLSRWRSCIIENDMKRSEALTLGYKWVLLRMRQRENLNINIKNH